MRGIASGGGRGPAGIGVPPGGTADQILSKIDGSDYNTQWVDKPAGGAVMPVVVANISNPPTPGELTAALGAPATLGAGYNAFVKDTGQNPSTFHAVTDGTDWFIHQLNKSTEVMIEYLVVGGGGGGGRALQYNYNAGGGGGGGVRSGSLTLELGKVYNITVGNGGAEATNGGFSAFDSIISAGGGRGSGQAGAALTGGSGGGGQSSGSTSGALGNDPAASPAQGYRGGTGSGTTGGGGGGAAEDGNTDGSGYGGDGAYSNITGTSICYGGGGGGGVNGGTVANQSEGGGGRGGNMDIGPTSGTNGLGGGGGGGGNCQWTSQGGGVGGSGIVIIKIPTASYSGNTTGSPSVSIVGSNTVLSFTSSGSYTG